MTTITTETVDRLELDLMAARRMGECVAYLIPFGPDYTNALAVADALIVKLRDRGVRLRIETARAENGLAYLIEDVSPLATA